jgi:hypothetical protein
MEAVLKHLEFNDIVSARCVSRIWNTLVVPRLLQNRLNYVLLQTDEQLSDFIFLFCRKEGPLVPFSRFVYNPNIGTQAELEIFTRIYGKKIVELSIDAVPPGKHFAPTRRELYYRRAHFDGESFRRISFLLSHSRNVEVLKMERDRMRHRSYQSQKIPLEGIPVPVLPKLIILDIVTIFR